MPGPLYFLHSRLLLVFTALALLIAGCDTFEGDKILAHTDPDSGAQVEVRSQQYGGKMRLHMQVTRNSKTQRLVLAEGVQVRHASLVRYNEWLLVLSGPYVMGGYQIDRDKIIPMNSEALPFTVRDRSGYAVDEKQLGEGEDVPPVNFREQYDPRAN